MGGGAIKKKKYIYIVMKVEGYFFFSPSDVVLAERGFVIDIFELVGMLVSDVKSLL